jgi:hypothetical protein
MRNGLPHDVSTAHERGRTKPRHSFLRRNPEYLLG